MAKQIGKVYEIGRGLGMTVEELDEALGEPFNTNLTDNGFFMRAYMIRSQEDHCIVGDVDIGLARIISLDDDLSVLLGAYEFGKQE